MNAIGLSDEHEANLRTLAAYLLRGELRAEFDMNRFSESDSEYKRTTCGSVGCAVGHGPYVGINKNNCEGWFDYSDRVFGLDGAGAGWKWCFDADWDQVDNTPAGAAKRILWLLENGLPDNWNEQEWGDAPLCYEGDKS